MSGDNARVARQLWELIQARRWDDAGQLLTEDVVIDWPHTGERIRGREPYLEVNRRYPEGWHIEILSVLGEADHAAIEVRVPHDTIGVFFVSGFYDLANGRIQRGREYWVTAGAEPPPAWRAPWTERA